jgi:hypothetical protein
VVTKCSKKNKAIPVTGHRSPSGCETSSFPHFLNHRLTDGGEVASLRAGHLLPSGRFLVLISVRGWVDSTAIVRLEGFGELEKSDDIGNRTCDLPACSIFFNLCGGTLGTAATTGLMYQPQMIGEGDCGYIGEMKIGRGNRSTQRKPAPAPLCPPQIPHD